MTHVLDDVTPLTWSTPTQADMSDVIGLVHGIYYFDNSAERMSETEIIESFPQRTPPSSSSPDGPRTPSWRSGGTSPGTPVRTPPIGRVNLRGGVHPAYRHKGIGRHLLEWQMQMTRRWWWENRGPLETDLEMYTTADAHLTTRRRMYEHAGFQEYRWFFDLHRDLVHELPERCACGAGAAAGEVRPPPSSARPPGRRTMRSSPTRSGPRRSAPRNGPSRWRGRTPARVGPGSWSTPRTLWSGTP